MEYSADFRARNTRLRIAQGAYFLLEGWVRDWDRTTTVLYGRNQKLMADIFRGERKYLLGLRTPCSGQSNLAAERIGRMIGLPLRWLDVSLDHLETVLQEAIDRKTGATECQRQ